MKLEIIDVCKSFGRHRVLDNVSFTAESGSAVGLLGRNGAGKTTTIRIIMGFFPSDSGQVLLDGVPLDPTRVKIGYLPEERGLYPKKNIGEQMVYLARLRGMNASDAEKAARRWLGRVELAEYYDKRLDTLSKGNQQKIQLALTLINDPDIIILDEPFSGLDPVNALMLKNLIREYTGGNKLALFSSHQMNQVEEFCDEIALLNGGKIALSGNLREIKRTYPRDTLAVSLDCAAADAAAAYRALDGVLASDAAKPCVSFTERRGDSVRVRLSSPERKSELLAVLLRAGMDLAHFDVIEPSLEEIFIAVTGEGQVTEA